MKSSDLMDLGVPTPSNALRFFVVLAASMARHGLNLVSCGQLYRWHKGAGMWHDGAGEVGSGLHAILQVSIRLGSWMNIDITQQSIGYDLTMCDAASSTLGLEVCNLGNVAVRCAMNFT